MHNPQTPRSFPLGQVNTYHASEKPHGISTSLPTWDSVSAMARKEKWVVDTVEWSYPRPRFNVNKPVRELSDAVLRRLSVANNTTKCMIYCTKNAAEECALVVREASGDQAVAEVVEFVMPPASDLGDGTAHWASFTAVLFPENQWKEAMTFWRDTGTGMSTRNAPFCLEELDYLESKSPNPAFQTPASRERSSGQVSQCLASVRSVAASIPVVKSFIAQMVTSEQQGQPAVNPGEVFLYPNGTNAIYTLSQTLASPDSECTVVSYGWLYPETVKALRRCAWKECIPYKNGSEEELDQLETMLSSGKQIHALFCEFPSNIKLSSPNLVRIRSLADKYGFIVACDDTVASCVNVDTIPYVDVVIASLTKTFSGASNVTGGSLVINPTSRYHDLLHARLSAQYETTFPQDVDVLRNNCKDVVSRLQRCSENTLPLVDIFKHHPSIAQVNHPSIAPTGPIYRSVMRKEGSYSNLLSIVFHDPRSAKHFYDVLDLCKGTSFGTNFTVAIPYVQLANYWDQEKVPKYGVPRHIIRISVGLEDKEQLINVVKAALEEVEKLEAQNSTQVPAKGLLPNDPVFTTLVNYATSSNQVVIRDPLQNIEVSYVQFLRDIIRFRLEISRILPSDILDDNGIIKEDNGVHIIISAPSNYQFLVSLFAILAVGGAAVLFPPNLSLEGITELAHKCNTLAVAYTPEHETAIEGFRAHAKETRGMEVLPIRMVLGSKDSNGDEVDTLDISTAIVGSSIQFSTERPALVQFTSGTTSSPKGVVHVRKFFYNMVEVYFGCPMSETNGLQHMLGPNAVYLSYRAFHWGGGIKNAMSAILAGVCTEIYNYDGTARGIWERLKKGDVKFFICWATMWATLKQVYEEELSLLPQVEVEKYLDGARGLRLAKSDSNLLMPVVKRFWADLGVFIGINYAAAETSISMGKLCLPDEDSDERSIGAPLTGVTTKLSEGDHGEIRLKSPLLFSYYIGEPEATRAAFDEEGYYKSGNLGHFDGKHYIIDGRVSQDFITLRKCRVSRLDVESSLIALPYITEAHAFGVPDFIVSSRVGALIRVKEGTAAFLTLETLRAELAATLESHQLPTVLRKLDAGTEIPKTHSGKPDVKKAFSMFLRQTVEGDIRTLPSEVEVWESAEI